MARARRKDPVVRRVLARFRHANDVHVESPAEMEEEYNVRQLFLLFGEAISEIVCQG